MFSVGIDMIEIDRIEKSMKNSRFCRRVLGVREYKQLELRGFPAQSVAASFCAKEAFAKCVGSGIRDFWFNDVELMREDNGRPYLVLSNKALEIATKKGYKFSVSVTHTKEFVSVVVMAMKVQK